MKKVILAIILLAAGFVGGYYSYEPIYMWKLDRRLQAKYLDKPAPAIETTTIDGLPWRLSDTRGKVVLLDFWAAWCSDCAVEIPTIKKIYEKYGSRNDFVMIGVSLDLEREPLRKATIEKGLPWLQLFEEGKKWSNSAAVAYGIRSIPSVWILDRQGIARGVNLHDEGEIFSTLQKALLK